MTATIHRFGDAFVNFYGVAEDGRMTLIDAGLPRHRRSLTRQLDRAGLAPTQLTDIVLTHAHGDHLGLAAELQDAHGARVWVHEADAALAGRPTEVARHAPGERSLLRYVLRNPTAARAPLHMARMGILTATGVTKVSTFTDVTDLDVPGGLRAVPTPGHTPGSTSYLLSDGSGMFTGDALVTHDAIGGHRGPCVICLAVTHDGAAAMESLHRLAHHEAEAVYPGHGEPLHARLPDVAAEAISYGLH